MCAYLLCCERFGGLNIVSIMDSRSSVWVQMLAKVIVIVVCLDIKKLTVSVHSGASRITSMLSWKLDKMLGLGVTFNRLACSPTGVSASIA